jgi:hypothetical protein
MKVVVTLVLDVDVQQFYATQPLEEDERTPDNIRSMIDSEFDNDMSVHPYVTEYGVVTSWEVRRK